MSYEKIVQTGYPPLSSGVWNSKGDFLVGSGRNGGLFLYTKDFIYVRSPQEFVSQVVSMDWSPDGKFLAFSSSEINYGDSETPTQQMTRIWNIQENFSRLRLLDNTKEPMTKLVWNPTKPLIAGVVQGEGIGVWSTVTGELEVHFLQQNARPNYIAWTLDGRYLLTSGYGKSTSLWDITTENMVWHIESENVFTLGGTVKLSHNGKLFTCIDSEHKTAIYNTFTGMKITRLEGEQQLLFTTWSYNDANIAGITKNRSLLIWDVNTGQVTFRHNESTSSICWNPKHNNFALSTFDGKIEIFDSATYKLIDEMVIPTKQACTLYWGPDGDRLLAFDKSGIPYVWNFLSLKLQLANTREYNTNNFGQYSISVNSTQDRIAKGYENGIIRIIGLDGKLISEYTSQNSSVLSLEYDKNRSALAFSHESEVRILWLDEKDNIRDTSMFLLDGEIQSVHWGDDNAIGATSILPNKMHRIELENEKIDVYDSKFLAAWNSDLSQFVTVTMVGKKEAELLIVSKEGTKSFHTLNGISEIVKVCWSPTSINIALGCTTGSVHIFDVQSDAIVATLEQHERKIQAMMWHPNQALLATGGADHQVCIWDVNNNRLVSNYFHPSIVTDIEWTKDGVHLITSSLDDIVIIGTLADKDNTEV